MPAMVCINKFDLNPDLSRSVENFATEKGLPCIGHIPFDPIFIRAMVQAQSVAEYAPDSTVSRAVKDIWERVSQNIGLQQQVLTLRQATGKVHS
ncbi:MAG: hypothetical protein JRJ46_09125 [Deltaproteobacteria bacterium]|nr:hypothetical protein [Deltaproteobacteria bacterium]